MMKRPGSQARSSSSLKAHFAHAIRVLRKAKRLVGSREYRRALRHGVAAGIEHEAVLRLLEPSTVIDVGANRGQFSTAARRCLPNAAIHAFEPLPDAASKFAAVFSGQRQPPVLYGVALGQFTGLARMNVARADDSSSLLRATADATALYPETAVASEIDVKIRRLDDVLQPADLQRPTLLKLDVQGTELDVIFGAEGLLGAIDHVYCEVSFAPLYSGQTAPADLVAHLAAKGFGLAGIGAVTTHGGQIVQADLLFSRRCPVAACTRRLAGSPHTTKEATA